MKPIRHTLAEQLRSGFSADVMATALAATLPLSTSATVICALGWLLAVVPFLRIADLREELRQPRSALPLLLVILGVLGLLWSDVSWVERRDGLGAFLKLLAIPLLFVHFRRSARAHWVLVGFIAASTAILLASFLPFVFPALSFLWRKLPGVPVKDYIAQASEFTTCAFVLFYLAIIWWRHGLRARATAASVLALGFLANIFYVVTSRTGLIVIVLLLVLFGARFVSRRMMIPLLGALAVMIGIVWATSPYLRGRVESAFTEVQRYEKTNAVTSAGERLEFWKKSVRIIATAPFIGHGTGSIKGQFRTLATGTTGVSAEVAANPHNQTLAVAIQLGALGVIVLWAMWIVHLLLFQGAGFAAWCGLLIVVENVVGSLLNSHLFDFTHGWLYVIGVGVAGGAVLRVRDGLAPAAPAQPSVQSPVQPQVQT